MKAKTAAVQSRRGPRFGTRRKDARTNKFGAKRTPVDGIMFDSAKEARRYQQLRLEERAGGVSD
jgi:hypothetical protein